MESSLHRRIWGEGENPFRGLGAAGLLCSRNAARKVYRMFRLRVVLVGRAHVETTQPPSFEVKEASLVRMCVDK
jgi:hypothetical protein